jgi:hypothetical protein
MLVVGFGGYDVFALNDMELVQWARNKAWADFQKDVTGWDHYIDSSAWCVVFTDRG